MSAGARPAVRATVDHPLESRRGARTAVRPSHARFPPQRSSSVRPTPMPDVSHPGYTSVAATAFPFHRAPRTEDGRPVPAGLLAHGSNAPPNLPQAPHLMLGHQWALLGELA